MLVIAVAIAEALRTLFHPIIFAATVGSFVGLLACRSTNTHRLKRKLAALVAENLSLKSTHTQQLAEAYQAISKQATQIGDLGRQVAAYENRDRLQKLYIFDERLGHYICDGRHFCHHCFLQTPPFINQLTLTNGLYWCSKCEKPPTSLTTDAKCKIE